MKIDTGLDIQKWQAWQKRLSASSHLVQLMKRDGADFQQMFAKPWQENIKDLLSEDENWAETDTPTLARIFRKRKRLLILWLSLLDYGKVAKDSPKLMEITQILSDFASVALNVGLRACMREQGFSDTQGMVALGMGKLGGGELNYSSDIDLILLYDCEALSTDLALIDRPAKIQRMVRHFVAFMEQVDKDGYIFRTDLRLRPDPASTPPAVEISAAVLYYESVGLAWERAAMLKACPIGGDLALGEDFLERIRPFIWRRSLDYASIEDIRQIRARSLKSLAMDKVDGANVKLVEGGIREIELYAQAHQLIWGGKIVSLRVKPTLKALEALAEAQLTPADVPSKLKEAYLYFRRLEHAVQLLADQQRHTLPEGEEEWLLLATLLNEEVDEIKQNFCRYRELVIASCLPKQEEYEHSVVDVGVFDSDRLKSLGFKDAKQAETVIARWLGGGYRVTASDRARRLLREILPKLLLALSKTAAPDDALSRMDKFLEAIPAGVQLFSLMAATPKLLRHCADIMGNAPRLALWLSKKPRLFEYLLHEADLDLPSMPLAAQSLEESLESCRRLAHENEFRTSVNFMIGKIDVDTLCKVHTQTAEVIISQTLRALRQENEKLPTSGFAILGLGKLGKSCLMPASDLDLMFISEASLEDRKFYLRLGQRLVSALSVATAEGNLYEVDLRLRPHGNAGALVTPFDSLEGYYQNEAWYWEYFALSQARIVYADSDIMPKLQAWLRKTQSVQHDTQKLKEAMLDMRRRLSEAFPAKSLWDIKHHSGGLMDLGFCLQFLQIRLSAISDKWILADMQKQCVEAECLGWINRAQSQSLQEAEALLNVLQAGLRVSAEGGLLDIRDAPLGQRRLLSRLGGCGEDVTHLEERLIRSYAKVEHITAHLFFT